MYILSGDWHLDSNPQNEYRWEIFEKIKGILKPTDKEIFILGDLVDKPNYYPATFVNRLITELLGLELPVTILRGNHDTNVRGPAYWEFLSEINNIFYINEPEQRRVHPGLGYLWLMPFAPNPVDDWAHLDFTGAKALFLHLTYPGAIAENGQPMIGTKLPDLPPDAKLYSGDIHMPQKIKNFIHVGAPHPVKFGDDYLCRLLRLDSDFDIADEIVLSGVHKLMIDITSISQLKDIQTQAGDQIKIRYNLLPNEVENWHEKETAIAAWAEKNGVNIVGRPEIIINTKPLVGGAIDVEPETIIQEFAVEEGISLPMISLGLELLKEVRNA